MVARLLDLTRLVSRLGKGPMTGVDRVEFAYLEQLLSLPSPVYGLVRSALGYLLLDRIGLQALQDGGLETSRPDLIARLAHRRDPVRGRVEAALRRLSIARCSRRGLARMLGRLPKGASYLNVGHANLDDRTLAQIHRAGLTIAVLVHDTIPLDHPEFARPDTVEPFRRKMQAVCRHADLVIHSTEAARSATEAQFAQMGRIPPAIVANLGVTPAAPAGPAPPPPYFVVLGTIEPRKNHALLLDVWEQLPDPPRLYIIGGRGWSNQAVFARLDARPAPPAIIELHGQTDTAVATLVAGAQALLFPSHAEGFGLPALEAAALGTPVVASSLPVFHELLGEFAVYLDVTDSYSWMETISRMATRKMTDRNRKIPPSWNQHFKLVLSRV